MMDVEIEKVFLNNLFGALLHRCLIFNSNLLVM
jgi:hypothetical protein